jgi:hypothetical protein
MFGIINQKHITVKVVMSSHGRDRMVVGFLATYAISAYHHQRCGFESRSG